MAQVNVYTRSYDLARDRRKFAGDDSYSGKRKLKHFRKALYRHTPTEKSSPSLYTYRTWLSPGVPTTLSS